MAEPGSLLGNTVSRSVSSDGPLQKVTVLSGHFFFFTPELNLLHQPVLLYYPPPPVSLLVYFTTFLGSPSIFSLYHFIFFFLCLWPKIDLHLLFVNLALLKRPRQEVQPPDDTDCTSAQTCTPMHACAYKHFSLEHSIFFFLSISFFQR